MTSPEEAPEPSHDPAAGSGPDPGAPDLERVREVARLASLPVDEAEARGHAGPFARMLQQFRALSQVDVEGVEPLFAPAAGVDVVRADEPRSGLERAALLEQAPASDGASFEVPLAPAGEGGDS